MPSKRLAALLVALLLAVAAPAAAAPAGFYGMNFDREISRAGGDVLTREWGEMGSAGVESVRTVFSWSEAQPAEGAPFDFSRTDPVVAEAARRQLSLLPVILTTPQWARKYPGRLGYLLRSRRSSPGAI